MEPSHQKLQQHYLLQVPLENCDTLKFGEYRLESYISQEKGVAFCIDGKNSTVKSVTLYSKLYCESLRQFNSNVSQKIATSLQKLFNDEKAGSEKSVLH